MSVIRGSETKPELLVRKFLHSEGFRYLLHDKRLPGKPDIVLPKYNTTIFVNGCFWHGHKNCKAAKLPETNQSFWEDKISNNIARDIRNIEKLEKDGWSVILIWQCEINNKNLREKRLTQLITQIKGDKNIII